MGQSSWQAEHLPPKTPRIELLEDASVPVPRKEPNKGRPSPKQQGLSPVCAFVGIVSFATLSDFCAALAQVGTVFPIPSFSGWMLSVI